MKTDKSRHPVKALSVTYHGLKVGTLADAAGGKIAFEYSDQWLREGFAISPFSLPLEKRVFVSEKTCFDGLYGVFADSLPDAWGRLLVDRTVKQSGFAGELTTLERLALVGSSGMGALEYEPEWRIDAGSAARDLDYIAEQCRKVLASVPVDDLEGLYRIGGSSGGARPKVLIAQDGRHWIVKFPAAVDGDDIGEQEYDYMKCAQNCGIEIPEVKLFSSSLSGGYFGVVRFDRVDKERLQKSEGHSPAKPEKNTADRREPAYEKIHMVTAAGLLEADFNTPCLDYHTLMKLTRIITEEHKGDIENMFRRACFNVYAHNRDDHAKNFAYIYSQAEKRWHLSPAYDLTYSSTYYGEHTTSVDGKGRNPGAAELLKVGQTAGIRKGRCLEIIDDVRTQVDRALGEKWLKSKNCL